MGHLERCTNWIESALADGDWALAKELLELLAPLCAEAARRIGDEHPEWKRGSPALPMGPEPETSEA
jgi:hypothetical protein